MSATAFGSFDDLLDLTEVELRPVVSALRAVILDVDPGVVEVVRLGDRAATYGVGPKKMSEGYASILPHAGWVNLGFYRGAELPDPTGVLEGTGARMRHVKIRSVDATRSAAVRDHRGGLPRTALGDRRVARRSPWRERLCPSPYGIGCPGTPVATATRPGRGCAPKSPCESTPKLTP